MDRLEISIGALRVRARGTVAVLTGALIALVALAMIALWASGPREPTRVPPGAQKVSETRWRG